MNNPSYLTDLLRSRADRYASLGRRQDALFELADAALAYLSLEEAHRRGWGSLYAALRPGNLDVPSLQDAVAASPLAGREPIYAVDVSVWPRCDAETGPAGVSPTIPPAAHPCPTGR
jgi:hypothetical protein